MTSWGKTSKLFTRYQKRSFCLISILCFLGTLSSAYADILNPVVITPAPISQSSLIQVPVLKIQPAVSKPVLKMAEDANEKAAIETLILEAVGEGREGMIAVGEVIRNRAKLFGKDFEGVCFMPKQFSCWNDRRKAAEFLKAHQSYYAEAKKAWIASENSRLTQGSTDYHQESIHPYWADAYRVSAQIGSHIFYTRS